MGINDPEIILKKLLQIQRSGDHALKVKQVLDTGATIPEQISSIKKIDSVYSNPLISGEEITPKELKNILKYPDSVSPEQAQDIFQNIKAKRIHKRVLLFWGDRSKIKSFAKNSHFIKLGLFPASTRFNSSARDYMARIQESARVMLPIMIAILKVAWAYISKKDYNLLQNFRKLCEELVIKDVDTLEFRRDVLLTQLEYLERYVLICHFKAEYPQIIQSSIQLIFDKYPDWAAKLKGVDLHLTRLIDISQSEQSILHIILAANIVQYGRYFDTISLTNSRYKEIINNFNHDCEPEIEVKINSFINKRLNKLSELKRTKEKIRLTRTYIDQFLSKGESGYDQKNLIEFYKTAGTAKLNFSADRKNISLFASNLVNRFTVTLWNIFIGTIEIERIGKIKVFEDKLFQDQFINIRTLSERFEKAFFTKHNFPLDRFETLRKKSDADISNAEREVIEVLDSFSHEVMTIGKKLATLSLAHNVSGPLDNWKALTEQDLGADTIPIPFWDLIVIQEGYFKGWKFSSTINTIISICFLTAIFFYDREFGVMLQQEKLIDKKINDYMVILKRICDPVQYEKINRSLK